MFYILHKQYKVKYVGPSTEHWGTPWQPPEADTDVAIRAFCFFFRQTVWRKSEAGDGAHLEVSGVL